MRRRSTSSLVIAAVLVLSGCGSDDPSGFTSRENLPSCGSLDDLEMGAPASAAEQEALSCIRDAAERGSAAEVEYSYLTTEGDPIRYWLRILVNGEVEMFQHSDDSFGEPGWQHYISCDLPMADLQSLPLPDYCGEGEKI